MATEHYQLGRTMTLLHPDKDEASRIIERAQQTPIRIDCVAYDDFGAYADAATFIPFEDARNPKTQGRLREATFAITQADEIVVTELLLTNKEH